MKSMKIHYRAFTSFLLILITVLLAVPVSAGNSEIGSVVRTLPDSVYANTEFVVTLDIAGQGPNIVGILETIPEGFTFPSNDEDITSSCAFIVDRNNGSIAFSAIEVNKIHYKLISSSTNTIYTFSGRWVDLLYQDVKLDESKERWKDVTGDIAINVVKESSSSNSGSSGKSSGSGRSYRTLQESSPVVEENTNATNTNATEPITTNGIDNQSNEEIDTELSLNHPVEKTDVVVDDLDIIKEVEPSSNTIPGFGLLVACLSIVLVTLAFARRKGD